MSFQKVGNSLDKREGTSPYMTVVVEKGEMCGVIEELRCSGPSGKLGTYK